MAHSLNLRIVQKLHHAMMFKGVRYQLGAKPRLLPGKSMAQFIEDTDESDCSGYVRSLVFYATEERLLLPEGSVQQYEWLRNSLNPLTGPLHGYDHVRPLSVNDAIRTVDSTPGNLSPLYIAFIAPTDLHYGHVWFVNDGTTLECYGGRGAGSRNWNARPLPQEVDHAFMWPHTWK